MKQEMMGWVSGLFVPWAIRTLDAKMTHKNRHLRIIAQLCQAISSQLRHISTIGKKLVKQ